MYILQFCEYFLNDSFSPSDRSIFPIFSSHLIFVIDIHVQYPRQLFFFHAEMCKRQGNFPTLRQVIYQGLENYMKDAAFWLLHELDTLESKRENH